MSDVAQNKQSDKTDKARRRFLNVWTIVGAIALTWVVVQLLNILSVPVAIVIWTTIIVFVLRGTVNKLEEIGINRTVGTAIGYVIMFAVLALVAFLLFSPGVGMNTQFANLIENVPVYVQGISDWANDMYARYAYMLEDESVRAFVSDVQASAMEWAGDFAKNSASGAIAFGTGLANAFMAIGFALVVAFWILMQLPQLGRECKRLVGDAHAEDLEMLHITFTRVMGGYIKGTLLQCAIIGVACGILFAVLGIPNSMALGGITGILNIIPIIGPWLGGGLAAIVGIFVSPLVAVIAILGTIVIQQFVYTFISPKIMSDSVDIHPALTLIALMAGSALGGAMGGLPGSLVGMLASIPAVAVAKSVFVYYFEKRTGRRLVSKDGVFFLGTPSSSEDGDAPNPIADATSPHPDGSAEFERAEKKRAENAENRRKIRERLRGKEEKK
ncbi:MAG: AI-2E family transporter [Ellagibacter isourolithinifaciens]|nr:AI-2E family transporter [Ellagibacter isourolithinifaciens]